MILTPEHGNLSDSAIAFSEIRMLNRLSINYYEVTGSDLKKLISIKRLSILNGAPLFVNGGGNLGTLWSNVEKITRTVIESNPNSDIVILPNTIFYENSGEGKKSFLESKRIYNTHKKLHIFAREETSYAYMKDEYTDVKLVPDMVLSLPFASYELTRKGCLVLLRSDIEKIMSDKVTEKLKHTCKKMFGNNITYTDMVVPYRVSKENRESELDKKWREFASAELVITDRLHAMIFSAITGTPCIVIDSKSPKVRGCYEWIKDLEYIRFADSIDDISEIFAGMPKKPSRYDNSKILKLLKPLEEEILRIMDKREKSQINYNQELRIQFR